MMWCFYCSADPDLCNNQRTFEMEGECYDYDADIDELFLLAEKLICPSRMGHEEVMTVCLPVIHFFIINIYIIKPFIISDRSRLHCKGGNWSELGGGGGRRAKMLETVNIIIWLFWCLFWHDEGNLGPLPWIHQ